MPAEVRATLPKRLRLLRRSEFVLAQKNGRIVREEFLRVSVLVRGDELEARLGLAVSRRIGNAVIRNRVKRVLREAYRKQRHLLPRGLDLVVVPTDGRASADYHRTFATIGRVIMKLQRAFPSTSSGSRKP